MSEFIQRFHDCSYGEAFQLVNANSKAAHELTNGSSLPWWRVLLWPPHISSAQPSRLAFYYLFDYLFMVILIKLTPFYYIVLEFTRAKNVCWYNCREWINQVDGRHKNRMPSSQWQPMDFSSDWKQTGSIPMQDALFKVFYIIIPTRFFILKMTQQFIIFLSNLD